MAFEKMNSAGYLSNHLARLFAQNLRKEIAPLGLAPAQFMTLLELWSEDGQTQKQLVERLAVEQATMANTIARMERDGLVVRKKRSDDARSRSIYLTKKAISLEGKATSAARQINQRILGVLSAQERKVLLQLMQRIVAG